jgi:hypothetical protein
MVSSVPLKDQTSTTFECCHLFINMGSVWLCFPIRRSPKCIYKCIYNKSGNVTRI